VFGGYGVHQAKKAGDAFDPPPVEVGKIPPCRRLSSSIGLQAPETIGVPRDPIAPRETLKFPSHGLTGNSGDFGDAGGVDAVRFREGPRACVENALSNPPIKLRLVYDPMMRTDWRSASKT
jgi:hypothetical protein